MFKAILLLDICSYVFPIGLCRFYLGQALLQNPQIC